MTAPTSSRWSTLATRVRAAEGGAACEREVALAHARFTAGLGRLPARAPRRAPRGLAYALLAAALMLVVVGVRRHADRSALDERAQQTHGEPARAHEERREDAEHLRDERFADGSRVEVDGDARVESRDARGATVRLSRGALRARVTHRADTSWHFLAGPYDVRVTGTAFELGWDPGAARVNLVMTEGSVVVTGPRLGDGVRVVAGERLEARVDGSAAAVDETSAPRDAGELDDDAPRGTTRPLPRAHEGAAGWRDLARSGRYAEAVGLAARDGFARECARSNAEDLLLLADSARLAGERERAETAYLALRRRFPSDARAPAAAFFLGRAAFDRGRDEEAIRWLGAAVDEAPAGPFAQAALGRLLEAHARGGDRAAARAVARRYLAAYPSGPHAAHARRAVGEAGAR